MSVIVGFVRCVLYVCLWYVAIYQSDEEYNLPKSRGLATWRILDFDTGTHAWLVQFLCKIETKADMEQFQKCWQNNKWLPLIEKEDSCMSRLPSTRPRTEGVLHTEPSAGMGKFPASIAETGSGAGIRISSSANFLATFPFWYSSCGSSADCTLPSIMS